jgi:hypothetical protein
LENNSEIAVKVFAVIYHTKRDRNGNIYWGAQVVNTLTGKVAEGHIDGGESNLTYALHKKFGNEYRYVLKEVKMKELSLNMHNKYLGCGLEDILERIEKQWNS